MKNLAPRILALISLCIATNLSYAASKAPSKSMAPSFGFDQETSSVVEEGSVLIDLYNSTGYRSMVRVGAFGGEVMVHPSQGNAARGIGYKRAINPDFSAYGMLFIDNDASFTNFTLGAAYTTMASGFILNLNAEMFNQSDLTPGVSETFMDVRGSAFYPLHMASKNGAMSLGVEIDQEVSPDSITDVYLGARWMPNRNIILDLGLYRSLGAVSPAPTTSTVATPAFVRVNVRF
jgi:hypothetical protein